MGVGETKAPTWRGGLAWGWTAQTEAGRQGKGGVFSGLGDQEGGSGRRADDWELQEAEIKTHRGCDPSRGSLGWWGNAREVCRGLQGLK